VPLRVLLVEDSPVLAERLREALGALDHVEVVDAVTDEASAVAAAKSNRIDVIILDLQLKQGTGFGVVQRLGKDRPKIIVFTNYMLPEYQRLADSLGVEYFLNKSRDYERLPQLIQELAPPQDGTVRH
jgi:DNA-binding NarL/FixJ family response regulator